MIDKEKKDRENTVTIGKEDSVSKQDEPADKEGESE
jgi:hypothetical protein